MVLRLFGLKKKGKTAAGSSAAAREPLEFREIAGAPAAASPPHTETVPATVGAAKTLRAVRASKPARKAAAKAKPKPGKAKKAPKSGKAKPGKKR